MGRAMVNHLDDVLAAAGSALVVAGTAGLAGWAVASLVAGALLLAAAVLVARRA